MDVFGLENSRVYTLSWWPKINDHVLSLSPTWNASRLFGAFILPFNPANEKSTVLELLATAALATLRVYMIYITITSDSWDLLFMSSSQFVEKSLDMLLKIPMGFVLVIPWIFLLRKPQISQLSYDLGVFDKLVMKNGYPQNYQFFHFISTIVAIIDIIMPMTILTAIRGMSFMKEHFIVLSFIGTSWSAGLLFNTTFNMILYHMLYRVEVINDLLRKLLNHDHYKNNKEDTMKLIRLLMRLHDKLGDIANNCSRCFAMMIILGMIHVLISQMLTTFALSRVIFYHYDVNELIDCTFYIIGTTGYSAVPIVTIWMAGSIKKRTIITWKLIHRFINTTDDIEIEDLLQQFSEQLNHRSPCIDFRFFDVDWPLLVKACSEAATYLVIMIQFDIKQ
uniref:Gustatory receptor n=1 Tax=Anopheles minimus TaxID=112268 RepID=A0A182VW92_9DIPT